MKKYITLIIGVFAVIIIAITLSNNSGITDLQNTLKTTPIKIGFIGPLTGPVASVGMSARAATEVAVDEINRKSDTLFELIVEDSSCDPKKALVAANKLMTSGVAAIVGDLCSSATLAFAPIAEKEGVPVISYGSSASSITDAGDYIFRTIPSDNTQGKFAAEYAFNDLKSTRVVILFSQDDYSQGLSKTFEQEFELLGGTIVLTQSFSKKEADFRTILTKLQQTSFDLIYAPLFPESMIALLKQRTEFGISQPVFSSEVMEDTAILEGAGDATNNVVYTVAFQPNQSELQEKVHALYPDIPVILGAPQAYDALHILAQIIDKVGTNSENIKNALYNVSYLGASGLVEFDKNGDLKSAKYSIKEIINGKPVIKQ